MRKTTPTKTGTVHTLHHDSRLLVGNRPHDPTARSVLVYTPPGYDPAQRYPLFMDLVGYTGSGASHTNWRPFNYNLPERLDQLINEGAMGPVVVVLPDCFTVYGGNQYINSAGTGPYMDYLIDEVIPLVEASFSCGGSAEQRAVFGKSSGGYGAIVHAMLRPDVWGAAACHSGDMYFEYCYLPDFSLLLTQLNRYGGSVERFLDALHSKPKLKGDEVHALMAVGMAAHYDGDPEAPLGFHLPVDVRTGRIDPARWARWLQWDPVRMVEQYSDNLHKIKGLFIDCGLRDQYRLLWGARMLHERLLALHVAHEYQEFDDDHSDVDYRMDVSLPFLHRSLTSET